MLKKYQDLLEQLREIRKLEFSRVGEDNRSLEQQEDKILDEMDFVWKSLTEKEIIVLNNPMHRLYIKISNKRMSSMPRKSLFFVFDVDQQSDIVPQIKNCIEQAKQLTLKDAILCDSSTFYCGVVEVAINIYLLCGLPGSGKSTWSKKTALTTNAIIINKDLIRLMIKGDYTVYFDKFYPELECFIMDCAENTLLTAQCHQKDVIIDECNISSSRRSEWIRILKENMIDCHLICVWFTENKDNIKYRMQEDRGYSSQYWQVVVDKMKSTFEEPKLSEGFDELILVDSV